MRRHMKYHRGYQEYQIVLRLLVCRRRRESCPDRLPIGEMLDRLLSHTQVHKDIEHDYLAAILEHPLVLYLEASYNLQGSLDSQRTWPHGTLYHEGSPCGAILLPCILRYKVALPFTRLLSS